MPFAEKVGRITPGKPCGCPPAGPVVAYGGKIMTSFRLLGLQACAPVRRQFPFIMLVRPATATVTRAPGIILGRKLLRRFFYACKKSSYPACSFLFIILSLYDVIRQCQGKEGKKLLLAYMSAVLRKPCVSFFQQRLGPFNASGVRFSLKRDLQPQNVKGMASHVSIQLPVRVALQRRTTSTGGVDRNMPRAYYKHCLLLRPVPFPDSEKITQATP